MMYYKIIVFFAVCFSLSVLLAGTISGYFTFECAEPTSFMMAYASIVKVSDIGSIDFTSLPYSIVSPPDWSFSITADFYDDTAYYAVGGIIISTIEPGNPMGVFPENPFHTVSGNAGGIEIVIDDTVDLCINATTTGGEFEDIYVNIYDAIPEFFAGEPASLERTSPLPDTLYTITDIPAGPKYVEVFKDLNGNEELDIDEPSAFYESPESNIVFAVGGFHDTIRVSLDLSSVSEWKSTIEGIALRVFPSPFNSAANIEVILPGVSDATLEIFDISGKSVLNRDVHGSSSFPWRPEGVPCGLYIVNVSAAGRTIQRRVLYVK